jgi:flagellar FliL protein
MADEEKVAEQQEGKGGGSNKLLLIVVVILLVLVIAVGVGVVFALMGSKGDAGGAAQVTEADAHGADTEVHEAGDGEGHGEGHGAVFPLETFIVNLKIKGSFLKADIQLVFADASILEGGGGKHGGGGSLDNEIPKIRDVIILILSSKEAREVLSIEGKEQLREEILTGVNEVLGQNAVTQVLFTDFIVQ